MCAQYTGQPDVIRTYQSRARKYPGTQRAVWQRHLRSWRKDKRNRAPTWQSLKGCCGNNTAFVGGSWARFWTCSFPHHSAPYLHPIPIDMSRPLHDLMRLGKQTKTRHFASWTTCTYVQVQTWPNLDNPLCNSPLPDRALQLSASIKYILENDLRSRHVRKTLRHWKCLRLKVPGAFF